MMSNITVLARFRLSGLIANALLAFLCFSTGYAQPGNLTGRIAYLKDGAELWLVEPDGSNNQLLWTNPTPISPFFSAWVDWHPNGQEIAFSSGHERFCSIYADDIYAIRPDGTDLRRVTNTPQCSGLAGYPKGGVAVEVVNLSAYTFFWLYVQGGDSAQNFILDPGFMNTIILNGVSDFGINILQSAVVYTADHTWVGGVTVDVVAGQTVTAGGQMVLSGSPLELNAIQPKWKRDGTEIAFLLASSIPFTIPRNPLILEEPQAMFQPGEVSATNISWSPVSDELLYSDALANGIFLTTPGGGPGAQLLNDPLNGGLDWLPDGSGFIFSRKEIFPDRANLFLYEFPSGNITQLTNFGDEFALFPSVSPDGQAVTFTWLPANQSGVEIRVITIDGTTMWTIADGAYADWGPEGSTGITREPVEGNVPMNFELEQNFPNPFNPQTRIRFSIPGSSEVTLRIYNSLGQEVVTLVKTHLEAGSYEVQWDGREISASGMFFYRLQAGEYQATKKLVLVK